MQTILYLVRHGESEYNLEHRLAGQIDAPLTETGIEQAREAGRTLADIHFDAVYSSDLQRASHTAQEIVGAPVSADHQLGDLRERTYGDLEGEPIDRLNESEAQKHELAPAKQWDYRNVPGMETDRELNQRFTAALQQIATDNPGKTVLVVAHGGPIRTVLMKLQNLGSNDIPRGSFKNAGYIKLGYDDNSGFRVHEIQGVENI